LSEVHSFRPETVTTNRKVRRMKVREHKRLRIIERFTALKGEKPLKLGGDKFTSPTQFLSRVGQGDFHLVILLNVAYKAHTATAEAVA
jgi:hypothetical protein